MSVRIASPSWVRWGRSSLVLALCGLPLYASCTKSEDTEPYIRATPGAAQGEAGGSLLTEGDACERLRQAAEDAYDRLNCDAPAFPECPSFVRPAGGSGCYEYPEDSVTFCEQYYEDARTCRELSVCSIVAVENRDLSSCELVVEGGAGGAGGAATGGAGPAGGADAGGAPTNDGGMPAVGGSDGEAGAASAVAGAGGAG